LPASSLAGVALLALLTGCGDDGDDGDDAGADSEATTPSAADSSQPPTPPAGVEINVGTWQPGEDAMSAALTGTVSISNSGCIHFRPHARRADPIDVLWPAGSELLQDGTSPMEIRNEGGEAVARIGTSLQVAGGIVTTSSGMPELDCQAGDGAEAFAITEELRPLPGN
jgi:hypothetical protein